MTGLGDRWDEFPEVLQRESARVEEQAIERAERQARRERRSVWFWRGALVAFWLLCFAAGVRAALLLSGGD